MKYVNRYEDFIIEKIDISTIIKDIKKDLGINLLGVATYGTGISAFIPLTQHIIKDMKIEMPLTNEVIILLIITTFAIFYQESRSEINKAYDYIKTHNLEHILNKMLEVLKSIDNIFKFLIKRFKTSIEFLTDMMAYTLLFTPLIMILSNMIYHKEISIDYLIRMGFSLTTGVLTVGIKNLIKEIYFKLRNKVKNLITTDEMYVFESKNDPIPEIANIKPTDKYAIFIFGPPAVGKSVFIDSYILRFLGNYKIFNPDKLSNFLKNKFKKLKLHDPYLSYGYIKKTFDDLTKYGINISNLDPRVIIGKNNTYVDATDNLLKLSLNNYMKGGNTFIYDTTGNDFDRIDYYVNRAKRFGYKIIFIEVKANLKVMINRNIERERTVPIPYQMDSYLKSKDNYKKFSTLEPDSYYLIVNNNNNYKYYKYENNKLLKRKNDKYI